MESSPNTLLLLLTGVIVAGMVFVLAIGWFKGMSWQRDIKMKKRHL